MAMESFENIYLDLSKQSGKCRFADSGLGWKPSGGDGKAFTLDNTQIHQGLWSKAARGYEVRVITRDGSVIQLDGFSLEDYDRLASRFKAWYGLTLENKEHALRGWNWGKADLMKAEMVFNVQSRPAFEIPYSEISNANLAGKNEVAVELSLPGNGDETGTNGALGGARGQGKKAGAALDQLVEMRFYIPGTTTTKATVKKEDKKDGESGSDQDGEEEVEEVEELTNAAELWYEELMNRADIGEVAGDSLIKFDDVLHLTPRGRFEVDLFDGFFRLRGKTYDYKIQYEQIKKFMMLPKPDDIHTLITIGIEPPLRQGQTRYPFLVMQFKRDEEAEYNLNLTQETIEEKYKGKLQLHYDTQPIANIMSQVFRGLTGKKVLQPSKDFLSYHQQSGVKCSIKANEGLLFMLEKSFMFVPKPATYIAFDSVQLITLSRVGGAVSASRTFDLAVSTKDADHQFSNINREEQKSLESFFKAKNLKFKNEMDDDSGTLLNAALLGGDLDSSDDEAPAARGSADEDSEEADEDFQADSESDVAEEFDEDHQSSGGSDEEMDDAEGDDDGGGGDDEDVEMAERPKKKAKTGK